MCPEPQNYLPGYPPAVIVHGLAQVQFALAAERPVTLLSCAGAASSWGGLWWQSLLAAASYNGPALLDCGSSPGRAVEALELGLTGIVLQAGPIWAEIAVLAAQKQALLLATAPPALDLGEKHTQRGLLAWLGGDSSASLA